jgi:acyl-CoA synthetase (AMP-forming)/AMP-acid ligase II
MTCWMNLGQHLKMNAKKFPNRVALKDRNKSLTYPQVNQRVNRLADSLGRLGLSKGDRVAVLMENSIEIIEIYLATAKTGLVIVPINFRLATDDIKYIANNSDAKAFIVHDQFAEKVGANKSDLTNISDENYIIVGNPREGYKNYEEFLAKGATGEPQVKVDPKDTWILIYTSGTTGRPKGVIRSHESHIAFYLINAVDFGFADHDVCMNVMPLCHINSTFFTFIFTYIGATVYIHPAQSFKAEEILKIIEREKITFISLIPTHYNLILNAQHKAEKPDVSSVKKLLCSSAPVRKNMKLAIMDFFSGVELYEAYGSTEAGIVTILKPKDQIKKLGSIGYETLGTDCVRVMDENGREMRVGETGELYSRGPMLFDEYYKLPEKTAQCFNGEWFSAGDMAIKDEDGFYQIVDRKDNMIITGGEHVYPSEVEEVIGGMAQVFDAAVISIPDDKWGEKVVAVVIPGAEPDEKSVINECRRQLASYKVPKKVIFIKEDEMPRTPTGKILHRILRERYKV